MNDSLPEGLHVDSRSDGTTRIVDAQDHTWVTLHEGANGDPEGWGDTIYERIRKALEITFDA